MTKSRRSGMPLYRFLALVLLATFLIILPAGASPSQSSCCNTCLQRFFQCDANNIVCCELYQKCVEQCQTPCQSCPDQ